MLRLIKNKYVFILAAVILMAIVFTVAFLIGSGDYKTVFAQDTFGVDYGADTGLSTTDIRISIIRVIRVVLGVLGVIALGLIIYGGFVWMTAGGNPEKINLAKKILLNTVIGLIIIMLAFAIVQYIFRVLEGNGGGPSYCTIGDCSGCLRCLDGTNYQYQESCGPQCTVGPIPTNIFRINDVQTSRPAGNGPKEDVYWCSKVQTIFNHNVDASTVVANSSDPPALSDPLHIAAIQATPVEVADGTWETMGNVVRFTPRDNVFVNQDMVGDHEYHIPTSLEDNDGRFLSDCSLTASCEGSPPSAPDFQWNFHIGPDGDVVDPYVTGTYPQSSDSANPDINVSRDPVIDITFSEPVDAFTVIDANNRPLAGNFILEELDALGGSMVNQVANSMLLVEMKGNGFRVRLEPPNLLTEFTAYRVTVQDIEDLCGNVMNPSPYIWEFATNDQVPGISSYYPTGNNVCPDTRVSITFNTTMYYDRVEMTITDGITFWNYILPPAEMGVTSVSDANGEFKIMDVDPGNISNNYRVFEFEVAPGNDLLEDTDYHISVVTDKIINVNGDVLMQSWDFHVTDLVNCVCTPYISHLSKDQGPEGDCITINGHCFTGTAQQVATISYINFDTTGATIGAGYSGRAVGTTVPGGFSQDDRPQVTLAIEYAANSVPPSNAVEFLITAGLADGPCLWAVQPNSGPRGLTGMRLLGDRFGDSDATRQVRFSPSEVVSVAAGDWSDNLIQNVTVPITTEDGPVVVTNDVGTSNDIYFDVYYCGDGNIDPGEECDGGVPTGIDCTNFGWVGGTLACHPSGTPDPNDPNKTIECQFNTSGCSNAPRVQENSQCLLTCNGGDSDGQSCYSDSDCTGTAPIPDGVCDIDTLPSPNPYRNVSNVCINAAISADFNTDINPTTINSTNIFIQECNDDNCTNVILAPVPATLVIAGPRSFRLTPASDLAANTTYQATITTGIASAGPPSINMENDYVWHFKTQDATCKIDRVYVAPSNYTLRGIFSIYGGYNASAVAPLTTTNCTLINQNYDWAWDISLPNLGVTVLEGLDDSTATVYSGFEQGQVNVIAAVPAENKEGSGNLQIILEGCEINPSICPDPDPSTPGEECPGSVCNVNIDRCTPTVVSLSPAVGPTGRWVTVQGCHFKERGSESRVDFGSVPVTVYPCDPPIWTDTQILVEVPSGLSSGNDYAVRVTDRYSLRSTPQMDFSVIADCLPGTPPVPIPSIGEVPGICSLSRNQGRPGDTVGISGENFGSTEDEVTFNNILAPITNWGETSISAQVPDTATDGDVIVKVENCPSNGLNFTIQSGNVGDPCDADINNFDPADPTIPICDPDNNMCWANAGLICDPASCTCQPAPAPSVIDNEPTGINICRNAMISATFDQEMDLGSINSNTFIVEDMDLVVYAQDSIWDKILAFFKDLFISPSQAQTPITGSILLYNINNQTLVNFVPSTSGLFQAGEDYRVTILSGANGVKSRLGAEMAADYTWTFGVGSEVCNIHHVDVDVETAIFTRSDTNYDYFTCAGRDDCVDDIDTGTSDNQHHYVAYARDANDVDLVANYLWSENDQDGTIQSIVPLGPSALRDTSVTPAPLDGEAVIFVNAFDPNDSDAIDYGRATTSVTAINFICQNPWPSLVDFPYKDSSGNCGTGTCYDMTFSTYYCRDYDHMDDYCDGGDNDGLEGCLIDADCSGGGYCMSFTSDDLPALTNPGNISGLEDGYCVGGFTTTGSAHGATCSDDSACGTGGHCYNVLKEFMFTFPDVADNNVRWCSGSNTICSTDIDCLTGETCELNIDSIGIRVYANGEHLSPGAWYEKYAPNPGGYSTKKVDGYEAIISGRTNYVNMAVDRGADIYTNMFLLSYTDNYQAVTLNIHDQLLDHLKFNVDTITTPGGVSNLRICTGGKYCTKDSDCPTGETCDAQKEKLARDVIRMGHLNEMIYHLDMYRGNCSQNKSLSCLQPTDCPEHDPLDLESEFCIIKNSTYPLLEAGTYIAGQSTSVWDSWNQTFASLLGTSLLLDPLNEIIDCGPTYNNECWDKDAKKFQCNLGSHLYHYEVSGTGNSYNLYANMEYRPGAWGWSAPGTQPCSPGPPYNLMFSR